MEVTQYLLLLRRWWWLLIIAAIITGGAAYVYGRAQAPIYRAEAKLFIGGILENPNPGMGEINTASDLTQTYANLVQMRPNLEATIQALGLESVISPGYLSSRITTSTIPETSILHIAVTDTNPVRAANLANELANQLVVNSPTNLTPEQAILREQVEEQIKALNEQIADAQERAAEIDRALPETTDNDERISLQLEKNELIQQITIWQQTMMNGTASLGAVGTQVNRLEVVETALVPGGPIGPAVMRNTMIAAVIGLALAIAFIIAIEYLDDTVRGPEDVRETLGVPVLSGIVKFGDKKKNNYKDKLVTISAPNSTPVEGYRALRTNLLYGLGDNPKRLIVTSGRVGEGKTVTAANLAVSFAKAELNTVIIDADLHRPQVHNIFKLENQIGMSSLFNASLPANYKLTAEQLKQLLQPTEVPYLRAITSGPIPANPAELLGLGHVRSLCEALEENLDIDIIVFDSPPMLAVVDSMTLASNVNGSPVLVVEARKTRRANAKRVIDQFNQVGVSVLGVVLNRVTAHTEGYYYYDYGRYGDKERKAAGILAAKAK